MIALLPRPKIQVQNNVKAEFETSGPHFLDLLGHALIEYRKLIWRRINSEEPRHPLVMGESDCGELLFQTARERRLSRYDISVNQVRCSHPKSNERMPHHFIYLEMYKQCLSGSKCEEASSEQSQSYPPCQVDFMNLYRDFAVQLQR